MQQIVGEYEKNPAKFLGRDLRDSSRRPHRKRRSRLLSAMGLIDLQNSLIIYPLSAANPLVNLSSLRDGDALYEEMKLHADPLAFMQLLDPSQSAALHEHIQSHEEREKTEVHDEVAARLETMHPDRDTRCFLNMLVCDYPPEGVDLDRTREATITIWQPGEGLNSVLQEGKRFKIFNLKVCEPRNDSRHAVQLRAMGATHYEDQASKRDARPLRTSLYRPRVLLSRDDLCWLQKDDEVDFVAIVVDVGELRTYSGWNGASRFSRTALCADADGLLVVVEQTSAIRQFAEYTRKQILSFRNLTCGAIKVKATASAEIRSIPRGDLERSSRAQLDRWLKEEPSEFDELYAANCDLLARLSDNFTAGIDTLSKPILPPIPSPAPGFVAHKNEHAPTRSLGLRRPGVPTPAQLRDTRTTSVPESPGSPSIRAGGLRGRRPAVPGFKLRLQAAVTAAAPAEAKMATHANPLRDMPADPRAHYVLIRAYILPFDSAIESGASLRLYSASKVESVASAAATVDPDFATLDVDDGVRLRMVRIPRAQFGLLIARFFSVEHAIAPPLSSSSHPDWASSLPVLTAALVRARQAAAHRVAASGSSVTWTSLVAAARVDNGIEGRFARWLEASLRGDEEHLARIADDFVGREMNATGGWVYRPEEARGLLSAVSEALRMVPIQITLPVTSVRANWSGPIDALSIAPADDLNSAVDLGGLFEGMRLLLPLFFRTKVRNGEENPGGGELYFSKQWKTSGRDFGDELREKSHRATQASRSVPEDNAQIASGGPSQFAGQLRQTIIPVALNANTSSAPLKIKLSARNSSKLLNPSQQKCSSFESVLPEKPEALEALDLVREISDGSNLKSVQPKASKTDLVIPLLAVNVWRKPTTTDAAPTSSSSSVPPVPAPAPAPAAPLKRPRSPSAPPTKEPAGSVDESGVESVGVEKEENKWGLQIRKKRRIEGVPSPAPVENGDAAKSSDGAGALVAPAVVLSLEGQAIAALLKDASGEESEEVRLELLPILAQNAVPGSKDIVDPSEKYKHDYNMRPDESTLDDYERIPIEQFGSALLRGMGWETGKPIGKNPNGLVEPVIFKARPQLLGLGATPTPQLDKKQKKYIKPGEKREADPLAEPAPAPQTDADRPRKRSPSRKQERSSEVSSPSVTEGAMVTILKGRYQGSTGQIISILERSSGTVAKVQLRKSDDIARVWLDEVAATTTSSQSSSADRSNRRRKSEEPESRGSSGRGGSSRSWLRPHIRLRIVSESLKGGRCYNQKCIVQDVVTAGECIVKLENGSLVEGVKERHVETVIPSVGKTIIVLYASDPDLLGQTALLKEKDSGQERVAVQMDHSLEFMTFSYDQVTEYVE
ncbi:hypothetical protein BDK51DRAFT_30178 [Blyttiomyces helicus]|uniref:G-patch domain-containing protein n=1 Tax=Blyttiomyces helicus TaxID=388810 RepID=A0A4P9WR95_9FUNG|nr:hypothetical protein BDK51DRAFT_30178 [Blyttiomyces helicus]|eukprot:RKO93396.1 hypothetical protein BDK51DRAFT_30178 [Blyttiomyces helicus]